MFNQTQTLKANARFAESTRYAQLFLLLILTFLCTQTGLQTLRAQTPAAAPAPKSSNRFLFIVETSKSMRPRTNAVLTIVNNLFATGMKGNLRAGDTVGLWTFNQELYDGRFPLHEWVPKGSRAIAADMITFLSGEKWDKQGKLAPVMAAIQPLIKDSENLTVVLISSGEDNVVGTPFDSQINSSYSSWKVEEQKQKMPFVTVFRGYRGEIVKAAATPLPWEVEIPPLPKGSTNAAALAAAKPQPAIQAPAAPVPSLIVIGKKPPTAPVATNVGDVVPISPSPDTVSTPQTNLATVPKIPAVTTPAPTNKVIANLGQAKRSDNNSASQAASNAPAATNDAVTTAELSKPAPPIEITQASTTQSPSLLHNKKLWIAFSGLLVLLAILLILSRRSRSADRVSLITRSIELKKK